MKLTVVKHGVFVELDNNNKVLAGGVRLVLTKLDDFREGVYETSGGGDDDIEQVAVYEGSDGMLFGYTDVLEDVAGEDIGLIQAIYATEGWVNRWFVLEEDAKRLM